MIGEVPKYIRLSVLIFALLVLILILLLPAPEQIGWTAGYFLGLLAVIVHLVSSSINKEADENFLRLYFISLFVRFLIVCALFILILMATKINEFSFTVSFIISYIFHSVNEVIFLNYKLSK
ncbi:MAG: hypothetical protein R3220_12855 [Balneolaceae bacterium]|nr:hypothetical protein [Balneolaceae bacterium]